MMRKTSLVVAKWVQWCVLMLLVAGVIVLSIPAHAQESLTITLGQSTLGEVTSEQPTVILAFAPQQSEPLRLTVQSLSSNFAPLLVIYDESGIIQRLPNINAQATIETGILVSANQTYRLQVQGVEGKTGQFVVSLTQGEYLQLPATELRAGMQIEDRVTPAQPIQRYQFVADRQSALTLQVVSLPPQSGLSMVLSDAAGQPLAVMRQGLVGGSMIIPPAADTIYEVLILHSGADRLEGYQLSLLPFGAVVVVPADATTLPADSSTTSPTLPSATPATAIGTTQTQAPQVIIPFDGPCAVASKDNAGVNVRRGPGVAYEVVDGLTADDVLTVTGRNQSTTWWQVEYREGLYGWVVDTAVRRGGDCTGIGLAEYPDLPDNGSIANTPSGIVEITSTPLATVEGTN